MKLTAKHYAQGLYEALTEAPVDQRSTITKKFLNILYQRGELKNLPEVVRIIEGMERANSGVERVTVTTAHAIPEGEITELIKEFVSAENLHVTVKQDADLLGGLTIETEDKRWDLSARGQLRALQHTLRG